MMTIEQLRTCIEKVRFGDKKAFEEIYDDMKIPLYTIIYRIVQNKELSEDIMHNLFVKLYQSPPDSSVLNPRAWIFQMAHNLSLNSTRSPQTIPLSEEEIDSVTLSNTVDLQIDISEAIKKLPRDQIEIISFHIYGEMKFREISEMIKVPLGTVLWKYQKAIRKLRIYFNGGK